MNLKGIPRLRIGSLKVNVPIVQGGMGVGISLFGLASAVARAGAIGIIATAGIAMLEPDFRTNFKQATERALRNEIRRAKQVTNGVIGVNIMAALTDFDDLVEISVDEKVDVIFVGAGLPLREPKTVPLYSSREIATEVVPIVSSARATKIIFQYWEKHYGRVPNAVVVEGPLAGGHLGFKKEHISNPDYALERIVPEVISVTKSFEQRFDKPISVIAAGGIYTGADIHKFIRLGAQGVQMATRFVATHECDASIKFKEAYLRCNKEDLVIIDSPVGLPGRAIRNKYLKDVSNGGRKPFKCPWKCLITCDFKNTPYCIADALTNAKVGNLEEGFAFAGANAYRINKIISVDELIDTLLEEYEEAASA